MKSRSAAFTTAMIAVCWLLFVLDFLSPKTQGVGQLTFRLGLYPNDVLHGEWWRLITYGFVHPAWYYILGNSIALFQAGEEVELRLIAPRASVVALNLPSLAHSIAALRSHDPLFVMATQSTSTSNGPGHDGTCKKMRVGDSLGK